jgi:hypothetical protein
MTTIKSIYWSAWQQLRDTLQARDWERKQINIEVKNKNKDEEKYTKNVITKGCRK